MLLIRTASEVELLNAFIFGEAQVMAKEIAEELRRRGIDAAQILAVLSNLVNLIAKGGSTDGVD